ncbi:MAG TPA: MarR family winged helix-turn-helix transcriptional regulator [Polyangiaceae bacterium]|nr:MarR family winged helix-turn-helix transcriptional regulator [Polyangiaceae bacterium]
MNHIAFSTKRAFHGFLRVSRKLLASFGLTAARFDMLYALLSSGRPNTESKTLLQSDLRRMLGVTAGVVSRMLHALEELEWVQRKVYEFDRRQRVVWLTKLGETRMFRARRVVVRSAERLVYHAICFGKERDPECRFWAMSRLEAFLAVFRRHFGDTARLYYPWGHPDD